MLLLPLCPLFFSMVQEPTAVAPTPDQLRAGEAAMQAYQAARGEPAGALAGLPLRGTGEATWTTEGMDTPIAVVEIHLGLGRGKHVGDSAFGHMEEAADGSFAWYEDAMMNTVREGAQADELMRRWGITQAADWRAMYGRAARVRTLEVEGRLCIELQLEPQPIVALGEPEPGVPEPEPPVWDTWFLDAETSLPVRTLTHGPGTLGAPTEVRVDWSAWRAVDGVTYPHALAVTISEFEFRLEFASWKRGVEVPDTLLVPSDAVLKARAEQANPAALVARETPRIEQIEERHFASIRLQCAQSEMQTVLSAALPESFMAAMNSGVAMTGPPTVKYHTWGDEVDLEAGVPMAAPIESKGRVETSTLAGGEAVVVWHIGPYERLRETHGKLQEFLLANDLEQRGACWEEYHTDPGVEPDPEQWRTKVVMPVQPAAQ